MPIKKEKLPRQAKLIAAFAILHPDDKPEQLAEKLEFRLPTKQPILRVIKYYWPLLVKAGLAGNNQPMEVA